MFETLAIVLAIGLIVVVWRATRSGPPADAPGNDDTPRPDNFDKP